KALPVRAIADRLVVSTSTVKRWIRRYVETGILTDLERRPRPRLTTRGEDAAIIAAVQNNPFSNAVSIREALHLNICPQTVGHVCMRRTYNTVPAIKERLTEQHRTGRLQFAQQYVGGPGVLVASSLHG
ncbi:putative Transposable element Tc1 transposase-like 38, partial [Homarus americanus]